MMLFCPVIFTKLIDCYIAEVPHLNMIVKDDSYFGAYKLVKTAIKNKIRNSHENKKVQLFNWDIHEISINDSVFADEKASVVQVVSICI